MQEKVYLPYTHRLQWDSKGTNYYFFRKAHHRLPAVALKFILNLFRLKQKNTMKVFQLYLIISDTTESQEILHSSDCHVSAQLITMFIIQHQTVSFIAVSREIHHIHHCFSRIPAVMKTFLEASFVNLPK